MSAIEKDQGSQEEKYLEKGEGGPTQDYVVPVVEDRYKFDQHDLDRVQRRLKQRHVQMYVYFSRLLALLKAHQLRA